MGWEISVDSLGLVAILILGRTVTPVVSNRIIRRTRISVACQRMVDFDFGMPRDARGLEHNYRHFPTIGKRSVVELGVSVSSQGMVANFDFGMTSDARQPKQSYRQLLSPTSHGLDNKMD